MNNKYVKFLICGLAMQSLCASERAIYEQRLSQSEKECDSSAYAKLIASENIEQWRKNYSLITVIGNCATSGNLNALIKANVSSGGQVSDTANFDADQRDALCFCGYDRTALGSLARSGLAAQSAEITQDLEEATKTLVENGASVDTGLLDSFNHQNVPVSQALIKLGANPDKLVYVGSNPVYFGTELFPVHRDVVNAFDVAEYRVSEYKRFQKSCYRRVREHLFKGTKYPNGSSYAKAQWEYGREYGRKAKAVQAFIKLFSKQS